MRSPTAPAVEAVSSQSQVSLKRTAAIAYGLLENLENGVHRALLSKTELLLNYSTLQLEDGCTVINFTPLYQINKKLVVLDLIKILILETSGKCSGMIRQSIGKEMPLLGK